jgi:mono/diheme cytochrome c family protein
MKRKLPALPPSKRLMRALSILCCLLWPALAVAAPDDYPTQVKPLLARHCVSCHGPEKQRGGLRLDSVAGLRAGGDSGPAIVPGKAGDSLLLKAICGAEGVKAMPPKGPPLAAADVALLRAWVDAGAVGPATETVVRPVQASSKHWSFQPVQRLPAPTVKDSGWVRNPIDRFILARLEEKNIRPSAEADRATLIRRLSLDLLGLPPTRAEVEAFVNDPAADAYEQLVDRLLASPHYGERWGRHWLDLARYADSNGFSIDAPRQIWKYRDWVIAALNRDLPFDRFAIEQLAGDLLPNATVDQKVATGFHRNTPINEEGGIDREQFRVEAVVDRVNTTGSVFLGLTIGCCQCHDHKFDPLSQREYYQLFAFLNSVDEPTLDLATAEQQRERTNLQGRISALEKRLKSLDPVTQEQLEKWEGSLSPEARAALPASVRTVLAIAPNGRNARQDQIVLNAYRNARQTLHVVAGLSDPFALLVQTHLLTVRRDWEGQIADLKKQLPITSTTLIVQERKVPRVTNIHLGGDFTRKGAVVSPSVPAVLPPLPKGRGEVPSPPLTRLDLARWLVDPANPLTPRVTVNRLWQAYFGLGLVETENDFGTQGQPPSHPELLDWLASEFVAQKWSLKAMHRLIVTSATYRQSSRARPDLLTVDPRNRLLARQNRLRLDAEVVRDVALTASGLLNPAVGGPSVYPPQPQGVYSFTQVPREWKASVGPDRYRRGLYTFVWRSAPHPALTVFDAPEGTSTCTRRNRSNTPLQALTLLNDQGFVEYAQGLAARVLREEQGDAARLDHAFRLCLARAPRPEERAILTRVLARQRIAFAAAPEGAKALLPATLPEGVRPDEFAAWVAVARVLMNLDEFITRE